ncbi:MAG: universal stress protein [Thermoproteota archaeon]|nr:universal stress protein [Thermoproteota archaeon]
MIQTKKRQFSRILVATDGSDTSLRAAEYAIAIATEKEENNASLLIAIHVLPSQVGYAYSSDIYGLATSTSITEFLESIKKEAEKWFDIIKQKADDINKKIQLKTEVVATDRSVVGAIVEYAEHESIDLIVIGTRGRSGFKKMLLGSVASGVVTYAHCPVMVVK